MATRVEVETSAVAIAPRTFRVAIWAPDDDELRLWVIEELSLMTWVGELQLDNVTNLDALHATDLVVAGIDGASEDQLGVLHRRASETPVIAIGGSPDARFARVLGVRLTSRELKQAVRELLYRAQT